jgi:small subunit ribosomal protein S17
MSRPRGVRRRLKGVVVSEKAAKTLTVEVSRQVRHPKYLKRVRKDRKLRVHDEAGTGHIGDVVEIVECRPMSSTKHWRLLRVVERNPDLGLTPVPTTPPEVLPAQ